MVRHILIAAWRNMMANRLISAIAILGLSVGIAAALLMGLVVRNQMTFDHFIPGYARTYAGISGLSLPGRPTDYNLLTPADIAALIRLNVPEVEAVTRLIPTDTCPGCKGDDLRHGDIAAPEHIYWAEPGFAAVLPLPTFRGDLRTALARPDGIVISRAVARKYFGRDDALGEQILLDGHPMTIRAVIEDLPAAGTHLESGIFASSLAAFSPFATARAAPAGAFAITTQTYLRLKPGRTIEAVRRQLPALVRRLTKASGNSMIVDTYAMSLRRIDRLQLFEGLHPGVRAGLAVTGLVGLLILFVSAVNFVNLLTARAARRAREVGVRKACGAGHGALVAQFIGEATLAVALATCVALALVEYLLPMANAFLSTGAHLDYGNALTPVALLLGIALLGLAAGAWPAFVLARFRPVRALQGPSTEPGGSRVRSTLTSLQFAILIALAVAAIIVWQQRVFATREGLRADIDQVLVVQGACPAAFRTELRKLPGVAAVACSSMGFLTGAGHLTVSNKGSDLALHFVDTDWSVFSLYGIRPLAGSLPAASEGRRRDGVAAGVVFNASAVRALGFASPRAAIGQIYKERGPIVAVIPDFSFASVKEKLEPGIYLPYVAGPHPDRAFGNLTSIKLRGRDIPETLAAIDRLWSATGNSGPISRIFLSDYMQAQYLGLMRQAQMFAGLSALTILLACSGLVGIAISTAERRTKEIGIRKAMGATTAKIVALLLWQFAQPVLWANLIAWPVAWWLMRRWLSGFAYHVDLHWWVFAAASAGALAIALLTVAGQAFLTARAKPVLALRYE